MIIQITVKPEQLLALICGHILNLIDTMKQIML